MSDDPSFSFARHALTSLGSAALVLAAVTVVVLAVRPGPGLGLLIVGVGIVMAVAVMAAVSRRTVRRAFGDDTDGHERVDPPT
ncbi:hypothetical protein GCM10007304_27220 [Rhodococcoides trifolii]|uniref:Uncharacterized protein n=1 Tax=Rhodococcoides trifolii TaxID=908250 RepID=A0A917D5Y0_9NOCA|nr:hypothetical protein [Rhodococcus trifolii]GGG11814.1 hypothetical protein GCM10007304_27220 [Rhodococcus trifolii]